jgi:hypothetical protein
MLKILFNPRSFDPFHLPSKNLRVHRNSNFQSGSPLGSVWVDSFTFSYTPESMKCDFQVSFSACTYANPCFGHKPKARIASYYIYKVFKPCAFDFKFQHFISIFIKKSLLYNNELKA